MMIRTTSRLSRVATLSSLVQQHQYAIIPTSLRPVNHHINMHNNNNNSSSHVFSQTKNYHASVHCSYSACSNPDCCGGVCGTSTTTTTTADNNDEYHLNNQEEQSEQVQIHDIINTMNQVKQLYQSTMYDKCVNACQDSIQLLAQYHKQNESNPVMSMMMTDHLMTQVYCFRYLCQLNHHQHHHSTMMTATTTTTTTTSTTMMDDDDDQTANDIQSSFLSLYQQQQQQQQQHPFLSYTNIVHLMMNNNNKQHDHHHHHHDKSQVDMMINQELNSLMNQYPRVPLFLYTKLQAMMMHHHHSISSHYDSFSSLLLNNNNNNHNSRNKKSKMVNNDAAENRIDSSVMRDMAQTSLELISLLSNTTNTTNTSSSMNMMNPMIIPLSVITPHMNQMMSLCYSARSLSSLLSLASTVANDDKQDSSRMEQLKSDIDQAIEWIEPIMTFRLSRKMESHSFDLIYPYMYRYMANKHIYTEQYKDSELVIEQDYLKCQSLLSILTSRVAHNESH